MPFTCSGADNKNKFYLIKAKVTAENTHQRGKCQCTADLLFDSFGFDQTSKIVVHSTKAK